MGRAEWAALLVFNLILGAAASGQQLSFVSCPVVRDSKTAPCFLADYGGQTYYLGSQQDGAAGVQLPQLKHQVLVEGTVAEGPKVCGGIPLQPVSISVLKEVNLACNTMLPPEPGLDAPVAVRVRPRQNGPVFTILFPFDDHSLAGQGEQVVMDAAAYFQRTGATKVKVAGYRATSVLSNGQRLEEKTGIAEKRAEAVSDLLRGLGVNGLAVEWNDAPEADASAQAPDRRRVTISSAN